MLYPQSKTGSREKAKKNEKKLLENFFKGNIRFEVLEMNWESKSKWRQKIIKEDTTTIQEVSIWLTIIPKQEENF